MTYSVTVNVPTIKLGFDEITNHPLRKELLRLARRFGGEFNSFVDNKLLVIFTVNQKASTFWHESRNLIRAHSS